MNGLNEDPGSQRLQRPFVCGGPSVNSHKEYNLIGRRLYVLSMRRRTASHPELWCLYTHHGIDRSKMNDEPVWPCTAQLFIRTHIYSEPAAFSVSTPSPFPVN